MRWFIILTLFSFLVLNALAVTNQNELLEKWSESLRSLSCIQTQRVSGVEYTKREKIANEIVSQALSLAFSDKYYDRKDSFLTHLLTKSDISLDVVYKICKNHLQKIQVGNVERQKLCNYMINTLYKNRESNPSFNKGIEAILFTNESSDLYTSENREIIKKCILSEQIHFFYADVVGITTNMDVHVYLTNIVNNTGTSKYDSFYQTWLATCMLAKAGDKTARKKVEDTAEGLQDLLEAQYIPLGMVYIGDKEMVLRLFKMLKSDLRKWNGEDAMPKESQLSHEVASVLSLCVKDFPLYKGFSKFTTEDKAKCLKWVEDHKETFIIYNKPPLYYFKNTNFNQLRSRQFAD